MTIPESEPPPMAMDDTPSDAPEAETPDPPTPPPPGGRAKSALAFLLLAAMVAVVLGVLEQVKDALLGAAR